MIEELREKLKDYYGIAATVLGNGNPFNCLGAIGELVSIDDLSDEEVLQRAKELGFNIEE